MSRIVTLLILLGIASLVSACRTSEVLSLREQLKSLPEWQMVRKSAQAALMKNEATAHGWRAALAERDSGAIYPVKKTGDTWLIHACDDYPQNRYGFVVEMEITSLGEVIRYTQLWKKANQALLPTSTSVTIPAAQDSRRL